MKLPLLWLNDYLPFGGGGVSAPTTLESALAEACRRWEVEPGRYAAHSLAKLMTFSGFACDGILGEGENAILELDVLSNRPDGQCILGLAREVAAILQVELHSPTVNLAKFENGDAAPKLAKVRVDEPDLCPRYIARVIRGVKVGPSPDWLQARLKSMGLQPRNNIVDVTNFVMFEMNQPLHAFDLSGLNGREITVRRARDKESFQPLYGEIPPLTAETLVIADAERPRAIAGVIGGKGSEVLPETQDILLEAAYFNPANTRRTVRRLKVLDGRGTESSYRFERGIDLDGVDRASARAAQLIVEVAGGTIAPGAIDVYPNPRASKTVDVRFSEIDRVFGAKVPRAESRRALIAVGCGDVSESAEVFTAKVPTWRRGDLEREIDLIEEVVRLYGFNHVPETTAMSARIPARSGVEVASEKLRRLLTALGYFETVSDSLIDPRWPAPAVWTKEKPIALDPSSVLREDHSALRNSLLASLLAVRRYNQDQRTGEARLFEIGKAFLPRAHPRPEEHSVIAIVDDRGYQALSDTLDRFADALETDNCHLKFRAAEIAPDFLLAGQCSRVLRVREMPGHERAEDMIGWLGTIAPDLQKAFDLRKPVAVCELDLQALAHLPTSPQRYLPLPAYPEIVRDVAIVVDENVSWSDIDSFACTWLKHDKLRDPREAPRFLSAFRGKQIGAGKKSVAFSLVYRSTERTLTDEEVNAAHSAFQAELLKKFNAALRA